MKDADLYEQLRRLGVGRGARQVRRTARRKRMAIEELLQGEVVDTDHGPYFLHRETYPLAYRHGGHMLSELFRHRPSLPAWLARDERLAGIDFRRMAFVDTETTGLAGGTGTYAFLVGVGVIEDEQFTVYQFFMRDYDEEAAQLYEMGALLDGLEAVVSFNGKSFDLPLLETRFIMAGQAPRMVGAPHLDLLSSSRRIWRHRLDSCALSSLETEVLGVERTEADVPGWLIPQLYASYARTGDAREMPGIFYHNAQDILSLVTLLSLQCGLLSTPLDEASTVPGEDLYGLGRLFQDLGQVVRAESAYALAARRSLSPWVRAQSQRELAYLLKRQDRRQEALPWWQELVESSQAVYACEELAMHYEWQEEDLHEAEIWTRKGIGLADRWPSTRKRRQVLGDLNHRLDRLVRKIAAGDLASHEA